MRDVAQCSVFAVTMMVTSETVLKTAVVVAAKYKR